ncbi:MAG: hypothetical protein IKG23_11745 [Clostridia bacterium]|nr:hypothetical protein [Clostridia bacterium]
MKKRLMVLLLTGILCVSGAGCAEKGLAVAFSPDSAEAVLGRQVAGLLDLPLLQAEEDDAGIAANLMLADPECVLLGSQDVLIAGLQGYTDKDLRKSMAPVCSLAFSPLFLVMDRNIAADLGVTDFASLREYVSANEYELTFARHIGADPVDRAVTQLSDELEVLTDIYTEEEIPDVLHSGEVAAGVFSGADLAASGDDWLILCCLGAERSSLFVDAPCASETGLNPCEGNLLCLFMSADAPGEAVEAAAGAAALLQAESLPAGYEPRYSSGSEFSDIVKALFADYKEYMTSEGLFFYEE